MLSRWILTLLLSLSAIACTTPTPDLFAYELLDRSEPSRPFRSIGDDLLLDQVTVEALKSQVQADAGRLIAVLQLPQGVHPYIVLAFIERDRGIEVASTSIYWGMIREKWLSSVDETTFESVISLAASTFACRSGPVDGSLLDAALVSWPSDAQVVCNGGWMSEEASAMGQQVQSIVDGSQLTYLGIE